MLWILIIVSGLSAILLQVLIWKVILKPAKGNDSRRASPSESRYTFEDFERDYSKLVRSIQTYQNYKEFEKMTHHQLGSASKKQEIQRAIQEVNRKIRDLNDNDRRRADKLKADLSRIAGDNGLAIPAERGSAAKRSFNW